MTTSEPTSVAVDVQRKTFSYPSECAPYARVRVWPSRTGVTGGDVMNADPHLSPTEIAAFIDRHTPGLGTAILPELQRLLTEHLSGATSTPLDFHLLGELGAHLLVAVRYHDHQRDVWFNTDRHSSPDLITTVAKLKAKINRALDERPKFHS